MGRTEVLVEALTALEPLSRELDSQPHQLSQWLEELARFSADFVAQNASGLAYLGFKGKPIRQRAIPSTPAPFSQVLQEFQALALTRGISTTSGRFFGYIPGGGLPSAAIGDYVAALTNRYAGIHAAGPGAAEVENSAIRWLIEMIGYPDRAWGTLQSGGSLATLAAVIAARDTRPPADWAKSAIYLTDECHHTIRKALHIAGLAHVPVRSVSLDEKLRMSTADLGRRIEEDRRDGLLPWMVFASAGTVNTGAVDPMEEIAEIAVREGLWFHVDAAYGGFFILTERARSRLAGMAHADSVVLDPHKGLFLPYGCGAALVRDGELLRKAFAFTSAYLPDRRPEAPSPADYSPELTRHFRGLRLWMSLKIHGLDRFRAALEEKLVLADLAHERLTAMPRLEAGPAPELSCVAFRVRAEGDAPTERLLNRVLDRGRVHLSSTRLWGRLYLRLCILCFRSHWDDLRLALDEIEKASRP